jgi:hypothetical protein
MSASLTVEFLKISSSETNLSSVMHAPDGRRGNFSEAGWSCLPAFDVVMSIFMASVAATLFCQLDTGVLAQGLAQCERVNV